MEDSTRALYLFRPAQLFGPPSVIAPLQTGKISVTLQFIVPGLHISKAEKEKYNKLIKNCLGDVWGSDTANVENKETRTEATLVTIAFYIDYLEDDTERHQAIENKSRILIERFLGIVSYCAGIKLSAKNIINTIIDSPNFKAILNVTGRTQSPKIKFSIPQDLIDEKIPSEKIFTALFWLRRGLAESDPIDTYNAFMVCLQIIARDWWEKKNPESEIPGPTSLFKKYMITELGADSELVDKAWKKRNAIAAHGNKLNIDSDDFIGLTELKIEAAKWAYQGINRALGLNPDKAPRPSQIFFVTDALMNLD
jgi:hypothetical protein